MPTNFNLMVPELIPFKDQLYVDRLRRFLNDTEILNVLEQVKESNDITIYEALQDALDEINIMGHTTTFPSFSSVPWSLLKLGGTLNVLMSQGILASRNQLTFNDSGGIQVSDMDKYGRYINFFNVLIIKYQRGITQWKIIQNVDACYGGIFSEYGDFGDI